MPLQGKEGSEEGATQSSRKKLANQNKNYEHSNGIQGELSRENFVKVKMIFKERMDGEAKPRPKVFFIDCQLTHGGLVHLVT